jgi:hypothetical protein
MVIPREGVRHLIEDALLEHWPHGPGAASSRMDLDDSAWISRAILLLAEFFQLRRAGLHELPAPTRFLDPIAIQHALHGPLIIPRRQPCNDPFAHGTLPSPIVL